MSVAPMTLEVRAAFDTIEKALGESVSRFLYDPDDVKRAQESMINSVLGAFPEAKTTIAGNTLLVDLNEVDAKKYIEWKSGVVITRCSPIQLQIVFEGYNSPQTSEGK